MGWKGEENVFPGQRCQVHRFISCEFNLTREIPDPNRERELV
jgi:hypothetical protein